MELVVFDSKAATLTLLLSHNTSHTTGHSAGVALEPSFNNVTVMVWRTVMTDDPFAGSTGEIQFTFFVEDY